MMSDTEAIDLPTVEEPETVDHEANNVQSDKHDDTSVEKKDTSDEKKEKSESPKKTSPKKATSASPKKAASASPMKKKAEKKEESEDEEEEEEGEEQKGLLDMPLVVEGKRRRSVVERIVVGQEVKHMTHEFNGSGIALGDIPFVNAMLDDHKGLELRPLYRLCFKALGKIPTIKRELRKFNGFNFPKAKDEYKRRVELFSKNSMQDINLVRGILGLERGQLKKEELVAAIMEFLMAPTDSGRKPPQKKPKGTKRKSSSGKGTPKVKRAKKSTGSAGANDDEEKESSGEESGQEEEEEEEKPKTPPPKKTPVKKTPAKKTPAKKTPAKKEKKKEEEVKEEKEEKEKDGDSDSVSTGSSIDNKDEDPRGNPSDEEVINKIEQLLKTFDLTKVSMKQMVLAVCEEFKGSNINERTAFLKAQIKEAISKLDPE